MSLSKEFIDQTHDFEKNPELKQTTIQEFITMFENADWFKQRPLHIQNAFKQFPVTSFYKSRDNGRLARITGFHEDENEKICAQTGTLMLGMPFANSTIGGWPIENLEKVEQWSAEDLENIELYTGGNRDLEYIFRNPFGFRFFCDD